MLPIVAVFLILVLVVAKPSRAPLRILAIAWLICVLPLVTGVLSFPRLPYETLTFAGTLIGFLACFVAGALLCELNRVAVPRPPAAVVTALLNRDFAETLPVARLCWWVAIVGTALLSIDFVLLQGPGLDDLAELRDLYVGRSSASIYVKLSSLMTWACVYCFGFALIYRVQLGTTAFARFLLPIGGFFLISLFSAGRQAAFQIIMFTLLILWTNRVRNPKTTKASLTAVLFPLLTSLLMVGYMGYIAVARNTGALSADKVVVLQELFDLKINPTFDAMLTALGAGVRATIIEGLVYFCSSIGLFAQFLGLSFPDHYFGAMSFPFVFRQFESITGVNTLDAYLFKVNVMASSGVIGVGWTSAISAYMLDFGVIGACAFLFVQGYYSAHSWFRAMDSFRFNDAMIAVVMLVVALYMPLVAGLSDTNILLLLLFCVLARQRSVYLARLRTDASRAAGGTEGAHGPSP
jgi:hypothetical protein